MQVDSQTTDGQAPTNVSRMDRYPNCLSYRDLLMELVNLMVESFLLQIKQLIVPLCLLKVLTLPPSMLAFFPGLSSYSIFLFIYLL